MSLGIAGWLFAGCGTAGFTIGATGLAIGGATRRGLSDSIRPIIR
jgi:uncharacterized protein (DUF849 family)